MKRTYGIAGNGRASAHLQAYLRLLKVPYKLWYRRLLATNCSLNCVASLHPGLAPEAALGRCTAVFVLIADGAIAKFISANPFLKTKTLIHFSGSLNLKGVRAMHPFMPLSERTLSLGEYRRIPFAMDRGVSLKELVPEFTNPVFSINKEEKKLYHALCALGANLPVLLWQKALRDLSGKFGIPRGTVQRYFQASLDNFRRTPTRPEGPISRKDAHRGGGHQGARKDAFAEVYSVFAKLMERP